MLCNFKVLCCLMTPGLSKDIRCHVWPYFLSTCKSDIRPHIKWAVSLVNLHMATSISRQGLCGYIWVIILILSPQRGCNFKEGGFHRTVIIRIMEVNGVQDVCLLGSSTLMEVHWCKLITAVPLLPAAAWSMDYM